MNEHDRKLLNSYFFVNGVIAVIIVIGTALAMLIITSYTLWNMI
jgi:hypothetical protein